MLGIGTATTTRPSMSMKSFGLHVYTGNPLVKRPRRSWRHGHAARACGRTPVATRRPDRTRARPVRRREADRSRLGLLEMCLASGSLALGARHQWTHGQFSQRHRGDEWLGWQRRGIVEPLHEDYRGRVQDPPARGAFADLTTADRELRRRPRATSPGRPGEACAIRPGEPRLMWAGGEPGEARRPPCRPA